MGMGSITQERCELPCGGPAPSAFGPLRGGGVSRQPVQGTPDPSATLVQDMGVDHGGADVFVAEELLDGTDVVAVFQEVGRERVAQRVAGDPLPQTHLPHGNLHSSLDDGFVQVVSAELARPLVPVEPGCGKEPLSSQLACWSRGLPG